MRWFSFVLVFVFLFPVVFAADDSLFFHQSLTIDGTIINPVDISVAGRNPSISSFVANVSWFPADVNGQEVLFFSAIPDGHVSEDAVLFEESYPDFGVHSFDIEYQVRTFADAYPVSRKVSFPLRPVSGDLQVFLEPTQTIDINAQMRSIAAEIAGGQDDLFRVVSDIAFWVQREIEYNLSTVNVEASQPSSYVLATGQGVCDEITNLFISLLRSLGIPARFVSGLSYTNAEGFDQQWGAHGWAEVYFPGFGWVPFDVTYGQFGWIDATHIRFKSDIDSGKYASSYQWYGRDVAVDVLGMRLDASVVNRGPSLNPLLDFSIDPLQDVVGLDSYNLLTLRVDNPSSRYVAEEFVLVGVEGLQSLDPARRLLVLAPGGSGELSWRVRVADLSEGYRYTFPLLVRSSRGLTASAEFSASFGNTVLAEEFVSSLADPVAEESVVAGDIVFSCDAVVDLLPRVVEPVSFSCLLHNVGVLSFDDVVVCLDDQCSMVDLPVGGLVDVPFTRSFDQPSVFALSFSAVHEFFEKSAFATVEVVDAPEVSIDELSAPQVIDYSGEGLVHFVVDHQGGVAAREVSVLLEGPRVSKSWFFSSVQGSKVFDITLAGDALALGENEFSVVVTYRDDRDVLVSLQEGFVVDLGEASFLQRLLLRISSWLGL